MQTATDSEILKRARDEGDQPAFGFCLSFELWPARRTSPPAGGHLAFNRISIVSLSNLHRISSP